jgi:hypothetical protein
MATMTIKSTYSMDPETVRLLDELARRKGISKSEALRTAIHQAAASDAGGYPRPAEALDQLQALVARDGVSVRKWKTEAATERRAASLARGTKGR